MALRGLQACAGSDGLGRGRGESTVKSIYLTDLALEGKDDKLKLEGRLRKLSGNDGDLEVDPTLASALIAHGKTLQVDALLEGIDIIAVNGGDPDFVTFALTK